MGVWAAAVVVVTATVRQLASGRDKPCYKVLPSHSWIVVLQRWKLTDLQRRASWPATCSSV